MIFIKRVPVFLNTLRIIKGYFFCKIISIVKGNRSPVFLVSGRDEDVFLYCSLLREYLEEAGVCKFTVLSDNDILNDVKDFYPFLTGHLMKISRKTEKAIQHAAIFLGYERLLIDSPKMRYDELTYNACAVRSAFPFSLYEYYNLMIFQSEKKDLKQDRVLFPRIQEDILQKIKDRGLVAGRTVILSPYSDMVKETEIFFWKVIKKELERRGYIVFIIDTRQRKRYKLENTDIKFSWEMAINLIEMAENYIGVKSSLSSMVTGAGGGKKVILYPVSMKIFDGNIESMGVTNYGMSYFDLCCNCMELTVPFLRSYGNCECENCNFEMRIQEDKKILDEILRYFVKVES